MFVTTAERKAQIVRVEPFTVGMHGFDLLSETMTRRYIELREPIDLQTEVRRWQEVANLSSPEVFNAFKALMRRENKESPFERSEEHTSELQSLMRISYAVFCLKKKKQRQMTHTPN